MEFKRLERFTTQVRGITKKWNFKVLIFSLHIR